MARRCKVEIGVYRTASNSVGSGGRRGSRPGHGEASRRRVQSAGRRWTYGGEAQKGFWGWGFMSKAIWDAFWGCGEVGEEELCCR
jgi:hypothetical protein